MIMMTTYYRRVRVTTNYNMARLLRIIVAITYDNDVTRYTVVIV